MTLLQCLNNHSNLRLNKNNYKVKEILKKGKQIMKMKRNKLLKKIIITILSINCRKKLNKSKNKLMNLINCVKNFNLDIFKI